MSIRRRKGIGAISLFLAFALAQTYIQLTFAEPGSSSAAATALPQRVLARVTTTGNRPISINNNSASSGDTVGTGAIIETPPGVSATIDLGLLGKFDLAPGTKIRLEFDENCNDPEKTPSNDDPNDRKCKARAVVLAGCVSGGPGKKGSRVEIADEQGNLLDSEKEKKKKGGGGGFINGCVGPNGLLGPPSSVGGGLSTEQILAIAFSTGGTTSILCAIYCGGGNPSPSTP